MVDLFHDILRLPIHRYSRAPQQPEWPSVEHLAAVRQELAGRPPLVDEDECQDLMTALALAVKEGQVLHAGDCAERFADSRPRVVARKVAQLDDLADLLGSSLRQPVLRIGRIAGQYSKPRSSAWEVLPNGQRLPVYRGDAVNDLAFDKRARRPDPDRLLAAYRHSQTCLTELRRGWASRSPADRVYASHEGLLLDYEVPLVRMGRRPFASSSHLLWVGDRTRRPTGEHAALLARISNPVAVKVGPAAKPGEIAQLCEMLNPDRVPGRLTLVFRLGVHRVRALLPGLVTAVRNTGVPVLWLCDPMHGNTIRTRHGGKTRPIEWIEQELAIFVSLLRAQGVRPHGLHLEITADEVTECCGGPVEACVDARLPHFRSACDPRLDADQARRVVAGYAAALQAGSDNGRETTRCER